MKIAVFFTYGYSINLLNQSGIFEREMRVYQELAKKGIQFTFFTYDKEITKFQKFNEFSFVSIYDFINFSHNKYINFINSFLLPFKISKEIKRYDILHQHQLMGSWIVILLKLITKTPLLIRTGYDAYLFSIKNNENILRNYFYKFLTFISLKVSDIYTVTSKCDYDFLIKEFGNYNIKIVPNFVEEFLQINQNTRTNNILMVGRLESQKNYHDALEFIKLLSNKHTLHIFGSGSKHNDLKKIVSDNNLPVFFHGNIKHDLLIEEYKKYKYFLSTSTYEGNPKTVLEALNYGCLVFLSNIPNHSELVEDSFNGFIFNDLDELITKFQKAENNLNLYNIFRLNNIEKLNKNLLENVTILMYEDYKSLIDSK